jgi:hypothetical protein
MLQKYKDFLVINCRNAIPEFKQIEEMPKDYTYQLLRFYAVIGSGLKSGSQHIYQLAVNDKYLTDRKLPELLEGISEICRPFQTISDCIKGIELMDKQLTVMLF